MASDGVKHKRGNTPNDTAWLITSRLIAGMIIYGIIGWLLSKWLGNPLFFAGGLLFGIVASLLLVYYQLEHETKELKQGLND